MTQECPGRSDPDGLHDMGLAGGHRPDPAGWWRQGPARDLVQQLHSAQGVRSFQRAGGPQLGDPWSPPWAPGSPASFPKMTPRSWTSHRSAPLSSRAQKGPHRPCGPGLEGLLQRVRRASGSGVQGWRPSKAPLHQPLRPHPELAHHVGRQDGPGTVLLDPGPERGPGWGSSDPIRPGDGAGWPRGWRAAGPTRAGAPCARPRRPGRPCLRSGPGTPRREAPVPERGAQPAPGIAVPAHRAGRRQAPGHFQARSPAPRISTGRGAVGALQAFAQEAAHPGQVVPPAGPVPAQEGPLLRGQVPGQGRDLHRRVQMSNGWVPMRALNEARGPAPAAGRIAGCAGSP